MGPLAARVGVLIGGPLSQRWGHGVSRQKKKRGADPLHRAFMHTHFGWKSRVPKNPSHGQQYMQKLSHHFFLLFISDASRVTANIECYLPSLLTYFHIV